MTNDNKRKCSAFVARFFVTFFLTGSIKFGAVLFDPVSTNDGFTSALTGLLFILPYATSRLLGPGINQLMNYFSPRFLASLGGFIFGAGYVCSGLCPLCPLYLSIFLTMSGMGLACMLLPTVLCLKSSFGDNFRAIMPIAMLGSFAGVAVIPTVTVYVLNSYGTSVCFILFGASAWNLVPCGLLLQADHLRKENFKSEMINLQQKSYHDPPSLRDDPTVPQEDTLKSAKDCHGISGAIKSLLTNFEGSMKQLANLNFVMFFIVANVRKIPNDAWMLYLIPHTIARGLSPTSAATVGSIGGIGGLLGRLVASISFKTTRSIPILLFSM
ncbi:uncharacterized protein [Apostichopus japonicus]|uniref:uncharacterized protein n=1 Tax=Stichopus japonicus TaxID=307972 RepID=UPI003AB20465